MHGLSHADALSTGGRTRMPGVEAAIDGTAGAGRRFMRRPALHPAARGSKGPCLWPRQQPRSAPRDPAKARHGRGCPIATLLTTGCGCPAHHRGRADHRPAHRRRSARKQASEDARAVGCLRVSLAARRVRGRDRRPSLTDDPADARIDADGGAAGQSQAWRATDTGPPPRGPGTDRGARARRSAHLASRRMRA